MIHNTTPNTPANMLVMTMKRNDIALIFPFDFGSSEALPRNEKQPNIYNMSHLFFLHINTKRKGVCYFNRNSTHMTSPSLIS